MTLRKIIKAVLPYGLVRLNQNYSRRMEVNNERKKELVACPFCDSKTVIPYRLKFCVVKCVSCKTVYLRERMMLEDMEKFYETVEKERPEHITPLDAESIVRSPMRREYFMNEILEHIGAKGELLDVGCAYGAFLKLAEERGFQPFGLELSKNNVKYIKEILGIEAKSIQLTKANLEPERFSVVSIMHVLEHMPNPKECLQTIYRVLKHGGLFCGMVPNIESFCSEAMKDNWNWLDPEWHYVHYSVTTLTKHLENSGFTIKRIYTSTGDFQKQKPIEMLKECYPSKSSDELDAILSEMNRLNLGEEIRFFALKA